MSKPPTSAAPRSDSRPPADVIYAVCLFVVSLIVLRAAAADDGLGLLEHGWVGPLLFAFGLYSIAMGFPHPGFGHVSFDRAGQIAAILLVGPLPAACICGAASFVYPWQRLLRGESLRQVLTAAIHNAGLMIMVVLGGGSLYAVLGGAVPLQELNLPAAGQLLALVLSMQLINDLGMLLMFRLRGQNPATLLTVFTTGVEIGSALIAILVALVVAGRDAGTIVLLLLVLTLGMLVLRRYAEMRSRLEVLVDERTRELQEKSLQLERQATRDKLTGLYNRHYADDYLAREVEHARRGGARFAVAIADVDHFKHVNDDYSHAVGDQVLAGIADLLVQRCRQTDIVARYGGEEFLLCFPDADSAAAAQICEQLRLALMDVDWRFALGDQSALRGGRRITMSFGVADVQSDSSLNSLLNDADARLYRAKHEGRNRVIA